MLRRVRYTPVSERGLRQYDALPPLEAIVKAWNNPGKHPSHHEAARRTVRDAMPLLARALDRLPFTEQEKNTLRKLGIDPTES